MPNDLQDFKQFMEQRVEASRAFVNGDIAPLHQISTNNLPATIFGPKGNCVEGAPNVNAANANGAKTFEAGSKMNFEILQMAADDGIAYWAGIQRSTLKIRGKSEPEQMDLRVTEIFRREDAQWKLVHRHADRLAVETAGRR